eukprot:Sspe_Gene.113886::Locus_98676_Transcript_1_1_Confidence_1.000_Length_1434::g.113886::m.113886
MRGVDTDGMRHLLVRHAVVMITVAVVGCALPSYTPLLLAVGHMSLVAALILHCGRRVLVNYANVVTIIRAAFPPLALSTASRATGAQLAVAFVAMDMLDGMVARLCGPTPEGEVLDIETDSMGMLALALALTHTVSPVALTAGVLRYAWVLWNPEQATFSNPVVPSDPLDRPQDPRLPYKWAAFVSTALLVASYLAQSVQFCYGAVLVLTISFACDALRVLLEQREGKEALQLFSNDLRSPRLLPGGFVQGTGPAGHVVALRPQDKPFLPLLLRIPTATSLRTSLAALAAIHSAPYVADLPTPRDLLSPRTISRRVRQLGLGGDEVLDELLSDGLSSAEQLEGNFLLHGAPCLSTFTADSLSRGVSWASALTGCWVVDVAHLIISSGDGADTQIEPILAMYREEADKLAVTVPPCQPELFFHAVAFCVCRALSEEAPSLTSSSRLRDFVGSAVAIASSPWLS